MTDPRPHATATQALADYANAAIDHETARIRIREHWDADEWTVSCLAHRENWIQRGAPKSAMQDAARRHVIDTHIAGRMASAVLAALDLHGANDTCLPCFEHGPEHCPELLGIAKALGIDLQGDHA